jgi:carbonic anhydrase
MQNLIQVSSDQRRRFFGENQDLLTQLGEEGQSPQALYIGCDDSRVIPEAILGAQPGDLFVLRNVANIVPPYGSGERAVGAALEFAIRHLQVKQIIICGHTDCGGIRALDHELDPVREPHLARWLEYARSAQTQVDARGVDAEMRHRAIVEQNVLLQLENLRTFDVTREALSDGRLALHGWVYELSNGYVSYWDPVADRFVQEDQT